MSLTDAAAVVVDQSHIGHLPNPVSVSPIGRTASSHTLRNRYADLSLEQIVSALRGTTLGLLKRGSIALLIARRELGGLFVALSKKITSHTAQVGLFRSIADFDYSEARRHMKLWVNWERIEKMLRDREEACLRHGIPFVTPGLRRCLKLAGITRTAEPPHNAPPAPLGPEPLPEDAALLSAMVQDLQQKNRVQRETNARLTVDLDLARDELREVAFNREDEQTKGIMGKFTGWLRRRRPLPAPPPEVLVHGRSA